MKVASVTQPAMLLRRSALIATCCLVCCAQAQAEEVEPARAWNWSVTPYIWLTDTSYDLRADGEDIGTGTIDFGELYDTLDTAFQVVVETGHAGGRWSGFVDLTYLSTSDDETVDLGGLGTLRLDSESDQLYIDSISTLQSRSGPGAKSAASTFMAVSATPTWTIKPPSISSILPISVWGQFAWIETTRTRS